MVFKCTYDIDNLLIRLKHVKTIAKLICKFLIYQIYNANL